MGMVNSKPQATPFNAISRADLRCLIANYTPQDGGFYEHGVGIKVKGDSDNLRLWSGHLLRRFFIIPPQLEDDMR